MNINNVLVPVDFSPPSTLAVNYGVALARKFRAKLSLLHVVESPSAPLYTFPREAEKVQTQRQDQAEKMLPALVGPEGEDDLDIRFMVMKGEIEPVIESVVHNEHADVVVMGTHGRGLFHRLLLGSVTRALLRKLGVPVLTVCRVSRPLEFSRILFATDFGPNSAESFTFALDMAKAVGSSMLVVHSVEPQLSFASETPDMSQLLKDARKERIQRVRARFTEMKTEATRSKVGIECVLTEGDACETLVRAADENEVDFVILGLRRKGTMERALLGSTAEAFIREAHVPVLSVPIGNKATHLEVVEEQYKAGR
jgi:nucleotide-binding universal stress UspA family protein